MISRAVRNLVTCYSDCYKTTTPLQQAGMVSNRKLNLISSRILKAMIQENILDPEQVLRYIISRLFNSERLWS